MSTSDFNGKVKRHVTKNFDQSIQIYQQFEEKHLFFRDLTLQMADRIAIKERSSILDIGCGCGISAKALNEGLGCKVLGVDLSHEMITAGIALCAEDDIRLLEGDGEHLLQIVGDRRFDYALYNASIFIFPDVSKTINEAYKCLKIGGKIAFSFYPQLVGKESEDLFALAFSRLGQPLPRYRVITEYSEAIEALGNRCTNICHHRWVHPLKTQFLQDFFSIPAQSASLFPAYAYEARRKMVKSLFATIDDMTGKGYIVWRMAEGIKPRE